MVLLFHLDVDRSWSTAGQLEAYRGFIVAVQVLCSVAGTAATVSDDMPFSTDCQILGFGMMLAPALDVESTSLMDVQVGCVAARIPWIIAHGSWGQIFTIATTVLILFLTIAFFQESRAAVDAW